ncbi:Aste57867_10087 [Aphanomyces stellatus]|uniref:Aste57867_10087 protein n=1 Tax=Aphanomyces stellatus TaxID=120398 RepID=A0A485KPZ8_9STRA|nr:hypothetical protein As57867_010048 [Aphanomyces stellatus]VFT86963.1 Aste57867_10087 [Aphanomyces stellatus]
MNVSALITGHETVGDHTEFVVQISCSGVVWLISRRFSDFDQLHCRLESVFQEALTARLPEKQWFGRFDPNFISKRQAGLQVYLDAILQLPGILDDRSLQHFFEIEKNVELHADHVRHSTLSVGSNGHLKHMSEADRWLMIVDKTAHALIDISEVPEPLEVEQAQQKRAEVLAALPAEARTTSSPSTLKSVAASVASTPLVHATTTEWLQRIHAKLEATQSATIQPPTEDLVAFMPEPIPVS